MRSTISERMRSLPTRLWFFGAFVLAALFEAIISRLADALVPVGTEAGAFKTALRWVADMTSYVPSYVLLALAGGALLPWLWDRFVSTADTLPSPALAREKAEEEKIARVVWKQGFLHSRIDEPWQLNVRIEFVKHALETGCYARWGEMEYYMSGEKSWKWSRQTTIMAPQTVNKGKTEDFLIGEIKPGTKVFRVLGDEISGHPNHDQLMCCEIIISSANGTQSDRRHYGLVASDKLIPVLIDQSRFEATV